MESVFLEFQRLNGTTWLYLSFLLTIAVYFQFARFFSLRNWDIVSLSLLVPGLLLTSRVEKVFVQPTANAAAEPAAVMGVDPFRASRIGYSWLFAVTGYFLLRALLDLFLVRRPRPEPNLNISGLAFLAVSLMGFLMYEVVIKEPDPAGRRSAHIARQLLDGDPGQKDGKAADPASVLFMSQIAAVQERVVSTTDDSALRDADLERGVAQSAAILCHLLIVSALIAIGWQHFDSPSTGMGMATLYLLLPVTAINVEKIDHLLPVVFIVWAVWAYTRPWLAGMLLAFAGVFVYPLFLLPLWIGFYWNRGARWFLLAFAITTAALLGLVWWLDPFRLFMEVWTTSVAWKAWDFRQSPETLGFWTQATWFYRLPIFITFAVLAVGAAFWPREKNLADLIALSVAIILGVQFWYSNRGGTYIHWYLPLLLLMLFRPNLAEVRPPLRIAEAARAETVRPERRLRTA